MKSLMRARQELRVPSRILAEVADVPPHLVTLAELGLPTDEQIARKLCLGLSRLAGKPYTLNEIVINIKAPQRPAGQSCPRSTEWFTNRRAGIPSSGRQKELNFYAHVQQLYGLASATA
ncbi:hypothetical protein EPA93_24915 [Ktedonosporobacter rubrisoli]|uniref:Uncharacterized protein n=1 Tax=Ktedonosporobacter rubrisoli TaxID=2509675 RepID=A0A4P6JUR1_KTERU|nr:hypothetical protein [Ktedonosporobacter rubrisoli]QBD79050.1 hypothetical protein EPA93_24915 [Ktedonosporobacter rubrisoli]